MKKLIYSAVTILFVLPVVCCVSTPAVVEPDKTSITAENLNEAKRLYSLGVIAYESKNYDEAVINLNRSLDLWSGDTEGEAKVRLKRAQVYSKQGKLDLATADLRRVIALSYKLPEAHYESAVIYYKRGDTEGALTELETATTIDEEFAKAYNLRGIIYKSTDKLDLALEEYGKAILYDDTFAPSYFNRAQVYFDKKDYTSALADFSDAISKYSDNQKVFKAQAYCKRAEVFMMLGNPEMADRDRAKAESLSPGLCAGGGVEEPSWGKGEFRPE